MGQGFTVNTDSLAIRIGELNAVVDAVDTAANYLTSFGGDLGPGGIAEAVQDVAQDWHDGLNKMKDKIHDMSLWVEGEVKNYEQLEFDSENRFIAKVDNDIEAAAEQAARQQARQARDDARRAENARHIPEGKI
jgi:hypothetical protein